MKVKKSKTNIFIFLKKHSPTILSFISAGGVVGTAVLAVKATPKAMKILEDRKRENGELTRTDIICETWKCYLPTIAIGISTIFCIFGANALNKHQQAALMSAYSLVSNSYKEYKSKLKELYGEEVHQNIVDSIVKDNCEDVYINASGFVENFSLDFEEHSQKDKKLFYDTFSKRYFESTVNQVIQAEYHINRNFVLRGYVKLNEFYDFIGLKEIDYGDVVGWSCFDGDIYWIDFNNHKITLKNGKECYVIDFVFDPTEELIEYI